MRRMFAAVSVFALGVLAEPAMTPIHAGPRVAWPQFRGPNGGGVFDGALPTTWTATRNVKWHVDVPGRGWSSPIAWDNTVFVTSAISSGTFKAPSTGIFGNDYAAELTKQGLPAEEVNKRVIARDIELTGESGAIRYMVYAFDAGTGKMKWQREAHHGEPFGGRHRKNTYASETPATDGERLYVYFGNVGVYAFSLDGTVLWTARFDPQPMYLDFGTAASPVVHDGRVFVVHDNEGTSFVAAVDAKSGRQLWRVNRDIKAPQGSGWSSPFIWTAGGEHRKRSELIVIGRQHAIAYDPRDGTELWRLRGLTGQSTPTPVAADGLLYLATGSQGESNRPVFAVRPGASGDISLAKGEESNAFVAWFHPRASAYTSSPLVYRGRMYVVNDNGILTVFDSRTGTEIYKARVGGGGHTFSASPWAADGKIYLLSEDGHTFVIAAGDRYVELANNTLDEMSLASPALAAQTIFLRTQTRLYRIGK
ncbi:MAG TPA: PQQ-binding-like beta-propeller repeat protein [Vicinamibacterales bacterium]|nr:PQQ-binding-like beta-propeller repeat protein [Vicinamibacterales bacterium]